MIKLNLEAKGKAQELIKAYLEENASETLAEKINNGVYIEKDGKRLINKKSLDSFMRYATDEAKKLAEKGANSACVEDATVYQWAIHYFEEESIIGTLYNEDGTEYKIPVKKTAAVTKTTTPTPAPKPQKAQTSIFDMLTGENSDNQGISGTQSTNAEGNDIDDKKIIAPNISPNKSKNEGSELYRRYMATQNKYPYCIVFIRLGDFYEAFNDSAVKAAKELGLTLTGRDCGLPERAPMCGVPFHSFDEHLTGLISKGYKVAVIEDINSSTPERIVSAKTVTENGQTVDRETGEIINDDELTEEEMREFDSYIEDEEELPTVSKITEGIATDDDDDFDLAQERENLKAFDKEALIILSELFDGEINIV